MVELSGIWVPLVTPFRQDEPDLPALTRLVRHLVDQGIAGFVVCGSTGEAALMDESEQAAVLQTTIAAAAGRPVLMGLAGPRPALVARRLVALAREHAPAGFLVSAPGYIKPSQAGLLAHFRTIADASPLPLLVYDIPSRTGVRVEAETLRTLSAHPRIVGVKDCSGDGAAASALIGEGRLAWLGGNDDEIFDQLARGARGVIAASAHLRPDLFVRLHRAMVQGQLGEARRLWQALRPLTEAVFAEPNPAPLKAALAQQGWIGNVLRAPMQPASPLAAQRVMACLAALDGH